MNDQMSAHEQQAIYQTYPLTMPNDFLSKEEVDLLKRTMLNAFDDDEKLMFIRVCQRTKLDPFTKQIYPTRRYSKTKDADGNTIKKATLVTVTGIMGLCAVADRTGNYDGCQVYWSGPEGSWKEEWLADEYPAAAKCIVYRKGRTHPEVAIARWFSFVGQAYNYKTERWEVGDFWNKMPDFMLAKCAKAAALRACFPDQLSNVYIREELDSDITDSEETESIPSDEAKVAENQRRSAEAAAHPPPGVTVVAQSGVRPTPAEALEPAFAEDKIPPKSAAPPPPTAAAVQAPPLPTEKKADPYVKEGPDELDMNPPQADELAWKEHIVRSVDHVKFKNRKVGELNQRELSILENQWLPVVTEDWENATLEQQADANAFKAAIAFSRGQKPW